MKNISVIAFIIITLILLLESGCAASTNDDRINAELKSLVENKWAEYAQNITDFNGGVAMRIISPGGDYFVSAGLDDDATGNIHFRAASTTKTFTAAAILLLEQGGKLHIDDRIIFNAPGTSFPYIPDSPEYSIPYKDEITIRQLLEHRAGVFDISNTAIPDTISVDYAGKIYIDYIKEDLGQIEHTFTTEELVGIVAEHQLSYFKPGSGYHYSDTGYSMLGKIIERVSGTKYASFIEENLLKPNDLTETTFPSDGSDRQIPIPYAEGYSLFNNTLFPSTEDNMSAHVAEGNMITTPDNLARWVKLLYSGEAGPGQKYIDMMTSLSPTGEGHVSYGLGTAYVEGLGYGHNGAHMGYLTSMYYDRENDVAIVIFASFINFDDIYGEIQQLYNIGLSVKQILGY